MSESLFGVGRFQSQATMADAVNRVRAAMQQPVAAAAEATLPGRVSRGLGAAARFGVPIVAATTWAPALAGEIMNPSPQTREALAPWQRAADQASAEGRTLDAVGNRLGAWGTGMAQLAYRGVVRPTMQMAGLAEGDASRAPAAAQEQRPPAAQEDRTPWFQRMPQQPQTAPVFGGLTMQQAAQAVDGLPNRLAMSVLGSLAQRQPSRPASARDILGADYIRTVREEDAAFRERAAAGRENPDSVRAHRERMLRLMGPAFSVNPMEAALAGTLP